MTGWGIKLQGDSFPGESYPGRKSRWTVPLLLIFKNIYYVFNAFASHKHGKSISLYYVPCTQPLGGKIKTSTKIITKFSH